MNIEQNLTDKTESKKINRNVLCAVLALLIIAIYILLDGWGMFVNSAAYFRGDDSFSGLTSTDYRSLTYAGIIMDNMIELYAARLICLVIFLFPVIFTALKFRISFKTAKDAGYKRWIPVLRAVLGLFAFYYTMTLGTVFSHELFTDYFSFGPWRVFFRIVGAFLLLGAFIVDWPSLIKAVRSFPSSHPRLFKCLFVFFISVISCMMLEYQSGSKMGMESYMLPYSILYWLILQVFIGIITRNVKVGAFVSLVLSYLIGLANDVVYQFRGNYIIFGDLTVVRTALEVAGNYTYKFGAWFWVSLILLILSLTVTILIRFPKHEKAGVKEILIRTGAAAAVAAVTFFAFSTGILYHNINGVGWDYNKNVSFAGYLPYFLSNMNAIKKVELEGYDADLAREALDSVTDVQEEPYSYPNIIIIQNEAFADLSVAYDIETNQDYMPFIHSMSENTQKGYLNMSVTGGPTANTEFEILTRSTLNFLPYGSVPYTQYVNADLPSIAVVLRDQPEPYHTVAYHSYYSSGYRRIGVYDHFGFDESRFEDSFSDDFPESDLPRGMVSDSANYRRVEQFYEEFREQSDAPWFCFNVTIQNHGGYTQDYDPPADENTYVTNFEATDSINSYLSLIRKSDDAFRELIEYFEQCDEPTIIAMYGDHQPKFDDEAVEVLSAHTVDGYSRLNDYYVPYVIWANFDIDESDTLGDAGHSGELNTLSTNYFASTVFETAGIRLTDYDRYLLDLHERVPAITAIGVWDSEGNYYASAQETPHAGELSSYQMVQYNLLFDDDNRLTDRFG